MGNGESCSACGGPFSPGGDVAYRHTADCRIARRLAAAGARRGDRDQQVAASAAVAAMRPSAATLRYLDELVEQSGG